MNMKKQGMHKTVGNGIVSLALNVAKVGANSACIWLSHQPKEPEELKKLKNN